MFCFDTNIVIDIFRGDELLKRKLIILKEKHIPCYITAITLCELFKGAYKSDKREEAIELITDFYKSVNILNFDLASTNLFGLNNHLLEVKGRKVPDIDLMIASIAMANDCILVTRDFAHFKKIPELKVEKW